VVVSPVLQALAAFIRGFFRTRIMLQVEILALRHQLGVYQRTCHRPRLQPADRLLWSWLCRAWPRWREALVFVQPQTVIAWRRRRFRQYWTKLSRAGRPGRPGVAREVRQLIRRLSTANPLWGAPRIVGELAKVGIELAESTVARHMVRRRRPPSATWRTFLKNHLHGILAVDFFVVPTVRNQVLFVFLVLAHQRRRLLQFNVTAEPTAAWTAQQIVEALPWDNAGRRFLLRDRDAIYGDRFRRRVDSLGLKQVVIAAHSPGQNPYAERLVGSIRRECLDHTIVLNERHLKRVLTDYFHYYHHWRTHQALGMDSPEGRQIHAVDRGRVVEVSEVGGASPPLRANRRLSRSPDPCGSPPRGRSAPRPDTWRPSPGHLPPLPCAQPQGRASTTLPRCPWSRTRPPTSQQTTLSAPTTHPESRAPRRTGPSTP
jgi:putative transposase